ncbi:MAG: hypothetical protein U1E45_05245 [Geminicoccaceae bacterium]
MLHLDLPTLDEIKQLNAMRADACVSIYLETTPLTQHTGGTRIELRNKLDEAVRQLGGSTLNKARMTPLVEGIQDLIDDDEFWRVQANSLAVLATPDSIRTWRLANKLTPIVEVSDRFHLKPLIRAVTFPHTAIVLALSENGVRVLEVLPSGAPEAIKVPGMPKDAASSVGKSSINDRAPSGRIQGAEGKKVRLAQYARQVDAALRPILTGLHTPLILAAAEPLASIYRQVNTSADLVAEGIGGNPDKVTDADLAASARTCLDRLYADLVKAFQEQFDVRKAEGRTTTDLAHAARAATYGAIAAILVDMDETVPGTVDDTTGEVAFASGPGKDSYGVVDEIAGRALATGATVLAVRKADIPGRGHLAAIMRYPF